MKNLFLTLTIFLVLLIIGCRENSITNPLRDSEIQRTITPFVTTGTITLDGTLNDPYPVMNSHYIINGEIQYEHNLEILDPFTPNPKYLVSLQLSVSADFTYLCTVCSPPISDTIVGTISTETDDNIYLPEEGTSEIVKTFLIQGRDDGMVLKCRFIVTTEDVELNEMWLELVGQKQIKAKGE